MSHIEEGGLTDAGNVDRNLYRQTQASSSLLGSSSLMGNPSILGRSASYTLGSNWLNENRYPRQGSGIMSGAPSSNGSQRGASGTSGTALVL